MEIIIIKSFNHIHTSFKIDLIVWKLNMGDSK